MAKLTLVNNGCPMMRAPTLIVMVWQPRTSSSSKSLFPKISQGKHTCLLAKESKCKVKTEGSSSPKYVSSDDDDDASDAHGMNEKAAIKRLGKELVVRDQLLEVQVDLLEQERKSICELKRLLKLEKEKNENLA
jgi:hypothetical protein